jgi:rhomboid family GlyGly-CTERM serine protease
MRASEDSNLPWRCELAVFTLLLAWLNLPLLTGSFPTQFIFHPAAIRAGEWWRLLTHPFAHVSWYHLALDATAFFLAYAELRHRSSLERFAFVAGAGAGSLLAALIASPLIATYGLGGLSGIAHGLAALAGLELATRSNDRVVRLGGLTCLLGVVGKSVIEATTGNVVFASWHLGPLGTPIAACHAGGVLGALAVWMFFRRR